MTATDTLPQAPATSTQAILDFDAVMRNPQKPGQLRKEWQSGDWLHPNPEGYKAMGEHAAKVLAHELGTN